MRCSKHWECINCGTVATDLFLGHWEYVIPEEVCKPCKYFILSHIFCADPVVNGTSYPFGELVELLKYANDS